jgi:hypothetical protein
MGMDEEGLSTVLCLHVLWTQGLEGGVRANLQRADLRGADLRGADLQGADLQRADLQRADLRGADLRGADLQRADLQGAYLRGADLRGADLDFAAWPLWCGSCGVCVDRRIALQLLAHFCALSCDDPEILTAQASLLPLAKLSHRAAEIFS